MVDVAHDRDDRRARDDVLGLTSSASTCSISSSKVCIWTSAPNSRAIIDAVSSSSVLLIVIISRRSISLRSTSLALTSSLVGEIGDRHPFGQRDRRG